MVLKQNFSKSTTIKLGQWNTNWERCKSVAQQNCIPMVAFWTPGPGCSWCNEMINQTFHNETFIKWQKNTNYIWSYNEGGDIHDKGSVAEYIQGDSLYGYPYFLFSWEIFPGSTIQFRCTGRYTTMPVSSGLVVWKQVKTSIEWFFASYTPKTNAKTFKP